MKTTRFWQRRRAYNHRHRSPRLLVEVRQRLRRSEGLGDLVGAFSGLLGVTENVARAHMKKWVETGLWEVW